MGFILVPFVKETKGLKMADHVEQTAKNELWDERPLKEVKWDIINQLNKKNQDQR